MHAVTEKSTAYAKFGENPKKIDLPTLFSFYHLRNLGQASFSRVARDFNPVIQFFDNFVTRNNFKYVKTIIQTLRMTLFLNSRIIS